MGVITLLSDFGTRDYYVAAMKAVLLRAVPEATLVDLSHDVPPGDLRTAGFILSAVADEFPDGTVHLCVVDPGVGSDRRRIAASRDGGRFVAPDNGLLSPILDGAAVRSIERSDLEPPRAGRTFDGRDRFAPAAAALASGLAFEAVGPEIADPVRLTAPSPPQRTDTKMRGEVLHIDRFGNIVTNLPGVWLPRGREIFIEGRSVKPELRELRTVDHYSQLREGEPGLLVGSLGTLELALRGISFADRWPREIAEEIIFVIR